MLLGCRGFSLSGRSKRVVLPGSGEPPEPAYSQNIGEKPNRRSAAAARVCAVIR